MLKENTNMNFNDKIKNVHIPLFVIVWATKRPPGRACTLAGVSCHGKQTQLFAVYR